MAGHPSSSLCFTLTFWKASQVVLQSCLQRRGSRAVLENHVAALDVGAHVGRAARRKVPLQVRHLDELLPADVDAAKQGQAGRHII
jgi:hypothetical protein